MPLMIDRFCSGGLPRPRFSGSMGSKPFRTRHSASVRSPRLKPASQKAALNQCCWPASTAFIGAVVAVHQLQCSILSMKLSKAGLYQAFSAILAYAWSAVAAIEINQLAGWQYDGNLGWWIVTAYSAPALALASPLSLVVDDANARVSIALVILSIVTVIYCGRIAVSRRHSTPSS